eukprot:3876722-Prymnesium_polylepis.1
MVVAPPLCGPQHEELVATQQATTLTPNDLLSRVLVKGKVKQLKEMDERRRTSRLSRHLSRAPLLHIRRPGLPRRWHMHWVVPPPAWHIRWAAARPSNGVHADALVSPSPMKWWKAAEPLVALRPTNASQAGRESAANFLVTHNSFDSQLLCGLAQVGSAMKARRKLDRKLKADKNKTDKFYSDFLSLRSEPVANFLQRATPKSVLPISSINEVSLLGFEPRLLHVQPIDRCFDLFADRIIC